MFEYLSNYQIVLVTGPQRSGTTICARMIAQDTGLGYVDEQAFTAVNHDGFVRVVNTSHHVVIQCPGMCRFVHHWGHYEDLAVVLMRRPIDEIIASQKRIRWGHQNEMGELANYDLTGGVISEVKYDFWDKHQRDAIKHAYEIDYHSLERHPLWVPAELRVNFHARQTEV